MFAKKNIWRLYSFRWHRVIATVWLQKMNELETLTWEWAKPVQNKLSQNVIISGMVHWEFTSSVKSMHYALDCGRKNAGSMLSASVVLWGVVGVLASSPENISTSEDKTRNTARPLIWLWLSCWNTVSASSTGNTLYTGGIICNSHHRMYLSSATHGDRLVPRMKIDKLWTMQFCSLWTLRFEWSSTDSTSSSSLTQFQSNL